MTEETADASAPEKESTGAKRSNDVSVDDSVVPEADVSGKESAGLESETAADASAEQAPNTTPRQRRAIAIGVRSLVIGVVMAILVGALATLAWLYIDARGQLDAQATETAADSRAEKISLDYAVNAATMDYKDLQPWKVKLVAGTSTELNGKLSDAATSMEQILVPLQWSSTAEPIVAKVRSRAEGILVVDCFISVQTKTVQAPEALQSTATYSITIDSNREWQITDVGGIGSVIGPK